MVPRKILVIRFSSIGDIVLTTPVVRCLKQQLNGVEVHYCTKEEYLPILSQNPHIDKIHTLGESLNELIQQLKKEHFDFIIDLHKNLRTRIIKSRLGVNSSSFDKLNYRKWLLVNLKINCLPNVHIVDRYIAAAARLDVKPDNLGLDYFIPEKDEIPINQLPSAHQNGYVAYAIGAQHATKKLPVDRMIELCKKINRPTVLLGDESDQKTGEEVTAYFKEYEGLGACIYNACGKFNINQSASLVRQADYVVTHDTGLMHIAAAFKKETVSIWGNTVPKFGMYPYKTKFTVLENKNISCRPCSKIGYNKCPKGHFKCMRDIIFDFTLPQKK